MLSKHTHLSRKTLGIFFTLILVCSLASSVLTYELVRAQGGLTAQTISGGPYAGAPSYTIFKDGTTYYAKDAYGAISYSSTDWSTTTQNCVTALVSSGGTIVFGLMNAPVSATVYYTENIIFKGQVTSDDTGQIGTSFYRTGDFPIFNSTGAACRHVAWENIRFSGAEKTNGWTTALIEVPTGTSQTIFESCSFVNSGGAGINLAGTSYDSSIINCQGQSLTGALVQKITPSTGTMVHIEKCIVTYGGLLADLYGVIGVNIIGSGGNDFDGGFLKLSSCTGTVQGVDIEGSATGMNGNAIWIVGGSLEIVGNRLWRTGNSTYSYASFTLTGSSNTRLSSNTVAAGFGYDVSFAGDSEYYTVEGNDFGRPIGGYAGKVNISMRYNAGYQTYTSFSGLVANNGVITFPFTLTVKPNIITVSCMNGTYGGVPVVVNPLYNDVVTDTTRVRLALFWSNGTAITDTLLVSGFAEYKP